MNTEMKRYIDLVGGRRAAAEKLDCSYQLVCKLVNGETAVTGKRAMDIITQFPEVSLKGLLEGSQDAA